ncbi:MAG TPA: hypothetical protein VFW75_00945, partial [Acetobacteraceae bacterium]|nr:hypothetical protein [Acetobacteraceae bacterium]
MDDPPSAIAARAAPAQAYPLDSGPPCCRGSAFGVRPVARRGRSGECCERICDVVIVIALLLIARAPLAWALGRPDAFARLIGCCDSTQIWAGVVVILALFAERLVAECFILARLFRPTIFTPQQPPAT